MNEEMLFAREDQVIDLSKGTDDTVDFQKFLIFIADDLKLGVVAESVVEILDKLRHAGRLSPSWTYACAWASPPGRTALWWSSTWTARSWAFWWTRWTR